MFDFNNGKCSTWSATNRNNASITSITLSEGPLPGIIIAVNIFSVSTSDYLDNNNWFVYITRVFDSLINLNAGFSMCLYNEMTLTLYNCIKCIYPVYLYILVIGVIIYSQHSTRVSNKTASYSVQDLASLTLLVSPKSSSLL